MISHRYNVPADQLRLFVHYPPSYYHFHVHVTHVAWEGAGALVGKAHLLDDIIGGRSVCHSTCMCVGTCMSVCRLQHL